MPPRRRVEGKIGAPGWTRWNLQPDEWRFELLGSRGILTRREMANSPHGSAIRRAVELVYRRLQWHAQPASPAKGDIEAAKFIESCMKDMSIPWANFINQAISNVTEQGFVVFEITYKIRRGKRDNQSSKYDDMRVGWDSLELRPADTIEDWVVPEDRNWQGIVQKKPNGVSVTIDKEKLLLLRIDDRSGSPVGAGGIFDAAYRSYYFIRELQNIEAIVEERMGGILEVGLPENAVVTRDNPGDDWFIAKDIINGFRADEMMGFIRPYGYEIKLHNPGTGARNLAGTIEAHKQDFFLSVLAQWALLGMKDVGSWSLSTDQSDFFIMALSGWLQMLKDTLTDVAIPRLLEMNSFPGMTEVPSLTHPVITKRDAFVFADALQKLAAAGWLHPGPKDEEFLREEIGLPALTAEDLKRIEEEQKAMQERLNAPEVPKQEQAGGNNATG